MTRYFILYLLCNDDVMQKEIGKRLVYSVKENINLYIWDDNNFSNLDPFGNESDAEYEKYIENI